MRQRQERDERNIAKLRKLGLSRAEAQAWLASVKDFPRNIMRKPRYNKLIMLKPRDDKLIEPNRGANLPLALVLTGIRFVLLMVIYLAIGVITPNWGNEYVWSERILVALGIVVGCIVIYLATQAYRKRTSLDIELEIR